MAALALLAFCHLRSCHDQRSYHCCRGPSSGTPARAATAPPAAAAAAPAAATAAAAAYPEPCVPPSACTTAADAACQARSHQRLLCSICCAHRYSFLPALCCCLLLPGILVHDSSSNVPSHVQVLYRPPVLLLLAAMHWCMTGCTDCCVWQRIASGSHSPGAV